MSVVGESPRNSEQTPFGYAGDRLDDGGETGDDAGASRRCLTPCVRSIGTIYISLYRHLRLPGQSYCHSMALDLHRPMEIG